MPQSERPSSFPSRLVGQYALVTGASQGIGRAVAVRLAQEGATVAINYFEHEERAAILGGTLVAGPADGGGYEVVAHLPFRGTEA